MQKAKSSLEHKQSRSEHRTAQLKNGSHFKKTISTADIVVAKEVIMTYLSFFLFLSEAIKISNDIQTEPDNQCISAELMLDKNVLAFETG